MPKVGGKKFPYTAKGKAQAAAASKKMGMPMEHPKQMPMNGKKMGKKK